MNPLVSVIIPTYNRAPFLNECIQSVIDQSYRPIELIIVDDGSTDNTIQIVEVFQKHNDSQLSITLLHQANSGAPRARNHGYEKAKGEYIQWLDSDDLLLPHKIESQISAFDIETDLVYSVAQFFDETPEKLMQQFWGRAPKGDSSDYFEFPWQTMCALYKKSAIEKNGLWDERLSFNDDWEFSMRYKIQGNTKFLDSISSLYRHHKGERVGNDLSISKINSLSTVLLDTFRLSKQYDLIDNYLVKRYKSRLMYCIIQYGALNAINERRSLLKTMEELGLYDPKVKIAGRLKSPMLNRALLAIYDGVKAMSHKSICL